jgi:RHS repeat-associated protein
MTDERGEIVWQADYMPFGEAVISVESVTNNLRFPGQYYDEETGLHYNYFRYYNPTIGRYMTPDPIGFAGGINLYAYCLNDPLNWIDPSGLNWLSLDWLRNALKWEPEGPLGTIYDTTGYSGWQFPPRLVRPHPELASAGIFIPGTCAELEWVGTVTYRQSGHWVLLGLIETPSYTREWAKEYTYTDQCGGTIWAMATYHQYEIEIRRLPPSIWSWVISKRRE